MTQVDAMVAAGGEIAPDDPLYPLTKGGPKALVSISGKPMVQWVLDALAGADRVGRVVVVGLTPASGLRCGDKPLDFIPSAGSMVANARAGLQYGLQLNSSATRMLWVSADIPTVRAKHFNWLVDECLKTDVDFCYSVIERPVMEKRFPGSRRSYTRLKGATVCGGDSGLLATRLVKGDNPVWEKITDARKNVFKQASLIGYETLLLLALRQLTAERAVQLVGKKMGITGRPVFCPYAEIGMDVDKPFQYEIVARDLERMKTEG
ncbi:MAG: NTP transferase domain-containing protein [Chloroflexi bacterium]|nr:NTP transferase domain-containing protein [Chloroflexota bacterium]